MSFLVSALTGEPGERPPALFDRWHHAMHDTAAALLQRAQHAGVIRSDIDAWDLLTLANGIALCAGDPGRAHRLLATIRYGIADDPVPAGQVNSAARPHRRATSGPRQPKALPGDV